MNIFKRLLMIGQAEIHSAVDKMEDPISMTEQGIREMHNDLEKALETYAQVKAMVIRSKNDKFKKQESAHDYENKAILLMSKAQKGEIKLEQAETLAREALYLKENLLAEAEVLESEQKKHEETELEIQKNIDILKFNITKWENELKTLKSRIRISKATKEVNKQMALIDSNSTISMLERMKEKVEEEEALAQAFDDIAKNNTWIGKIERMLEGDKDKVSDDLTEIKKKLGLQ